MIRLNLNSAMLRSVIFNKINKTLEIEFKEGIKTSDCIDIPVSILEDYINSIKQEEDLDNNHPSYLKIVHSNFAY